MSGNLPFEKITLTGQRRYSEWRTSAYECEVDFSGVLVKKKGKYISGWYGPFGGNRLDNEIMPKLAKYVAAGKGSYPFLITKHRLESGAKVDILSPKTLKFYPRRQKSQPIWFAVILSRTEYKLLPTGII